MNQNGIFLMHDHLSFLLILPKQISKLDPIGYFREKKLVCIDVKNISIPCT